MPADAWIPGPPPGRGTYWIVWRGSDGTLVTVADVSSALVNPSGRLLLKFVDGWAYHLEVVRDRILHHMPIAYPDPPAEVTDAR